MQKFISHTFVFEKNKKEFTFMFSYNGGRYKL